MKPRHPLAPALYLLAAAILLHGVLGFLKGSPLANPIPVSAQTIAGDKPPQFYYLGRDTYFLTTAQDGRTVELWFYDYNPEKARNTVEHLSTHKANQ